MFEGVRQRNGIELYVSRQKRWRPYTLGGFRSETRKGTSRADAYLREHIHEPECATAILKYLDAQTRMSGRNQARKK